MVTSFTSPRKSQVGDRFVEKRAELIPPISVTDRQFKQISLSPGEEFADLGIVFGVYIALSLFVEPCLCRHIWLSFRVNCASACIHLVR